MSETASTPSTAAGHDPIDSPRVRTAFRTLAFAEAVSWAALLVAMFFKWIVQADPHTGIEGGVPIAGPIHGALFVAYCATTLVAWRTYGWSTRTLVLGLLASVPPFFTVVFEVVADRKGLLGRPARAPQA
jgi:integral membrane protein